MTYFHFEQEPYIKEGKKTYRIINDVERRVRPGEDSKRIQVGAVGGFVEKPELINPEQDFWVYADSVVFGNTTIDGKVSIHNAYVKDCKIHGNVQIGEVNPPEYIDDILCTGKILVKAENCVLDSRNLSTDMNGERKAFSNIKIMGGAYVQNSKIYGCSDISGRCHILGSEIYSSYISDYCAVIKSIICENSIIRGSGFVSNSSLYACDVQENAVIGSSTLRKIKAIGHDLYVDNVLKEGLIRTTA